MPVTDCIMFPEYDIATDAAFTLTSDIRTLHPLERNAIRRSAPGRRREFAAGRNAAHLALERIGATGSCIERSADGQPVWPARVVGSISHDNDIAVAAVTRDARILGLGIDIESCQTVIPLNLAPRFLCANELASVDTRNSDAAGMALTRIVSCKEAAYKGVYPLAGEDFGFTDIEVRFDGAASRYSVIPAARLESCALLHAGRGRIETHSKHRVAMFIIETNPVEGHH